MDRFIYNLKEKLNNNIQAIESTEHDIFQKFTKIISVLEKAFEELKTFVAGYTFRDQAEEIHFFKEAKPQISNQLMYYNEVYNIEMRMPTGTSNDKRVYLENILGRIKYFFDMNFDFYHYYRSGSTHLDKYYFLRGKPDIQLILDSFYFEKDTQFSTSHDFKVSNILAYEMLTVYLNNRLSKLEHPLQAVDKNPNCLKVRHTWTGKKVELIELVYALEKGGYIDNGQINIKDLITYIENIFNVDLGDFYHAYLKMRERKGIRTIFIDKLRKDLDERMDESDVR
ncbi:hypothetical protein EZS27_020577 [termite gut metagenome]|uniref:RteC protein n=1 Tax=termite gut metagenome TaxID=433724 RepID=A0A5J4RD08_9ZZZZ